MNEVEKLYSEGKTIREIAEELDLSFYETRKIIKSSTEIKMRDRCENNSGKFTNNNIPKNKVIVTEEVEKEITEMFNNYASIKEISEKIGIGEKPVSRIIKELGLSRDRHTMYVLSQNKN